VHNFTPYPALLGGLLIGLSASLMLLLKGRIAGISGIVGGLLQPAPGELFWRCLFLLGLLSAPLFMLLLTGAMPQVHATASDRTLIAAGLLVGFGSYLGNGCTSGHGVCGLARRSKRSLVATLTFMLTGAVTVFLLRHGFAAGGAP
jgi:uncharacterized membrane protein YedE/YeeE